MGFFFVCVCDGNFTSRGESKKDFLTALISSCHCPVGGGIKVAAVAESRRSQCVASFSSERFV